jgi:hypothetical protein
MDTQCAAQAGFSQKIYQEITIHLLDFRACTPGQYRSGLAGGPEARDSVLAHLRCLGQMTPSSVVRIMFLNF